MSMKNTSDTIGNRTHDLPTCSAVPQSTALRRALIIIILLLLLSGNNGYASAPRYYVIRSSSLVFLSRETEYFANRLFL